MLVSVIIPFHNDSPQEIERTLLSVLNQTYKHIEIVVIDDGSTTPFANIQHKFSGYDIQWITNKKNMGVAYSRNLAVKRAKGDFIAFLDTGDTWKNNKLEEQIRLYNDPKLPKPCVIYTGAYAYSKKYKHKRIPYYKGKIYPKILTENFIVGSNSAVLIPREILEEVGGYDITNEIPEDWDLWIRISKKYNFYFVNKPLVNLDINPFSRSSDLNKKKISYFNIICKYKDEILANNLLNDCLGYYYFSLSLVAQKNNNYKRTIYYAFKSFIIDPTPFRFYILLKRIIRFNSIP